MAEKHYRCILEQLLLQMGEYVTFEQLVTQGISERQVREFADWAMYKGLPVLCDSEALCWPEQLNDLSPQVLEVMGEGCIPCRQVYYQEIVDSTNLWARRAIEAGPVPEGTVFAAGSQEGGRGRLGRSWASPTGGLWFTVVLTPTRSPAEWGGLSLISGMTAVNVLSAFAPECRVKWPNDVYLGDKKIAGILLEMVRESDKISYVIAGIGVNVNNSASSLPEDVVGKATSLRDHTGRLYSLNLILARFLNRLERDYHRFLNYGFASFRTEYQKICCHHGQMVEVQQGEQVLKGLNIGLDDYGGLLIKESSGKISVVHSGDLLLRG